KDQTGQERDTGEDRHHDPAVPPPGPTRFIDLLARRAGRLVLAGTRRAHASAPAPQQPGTMHVESTQGARSSTANVTSTSATSAAARRSEERRVGDGCRAGEEGVQRRREA